MDAITIGNRKVGSGEPVFIIAEAGVNHNGDLDLARRLIDAAAEAGADAVKFQTFVADRLVTRAAPKAEYQRQTTDTKESQYEMLKKLELLPDAHRELKLRAEQHGMVFLSAPFDSESADLLEKLDVPAFKIGSGELTDLPLLEHIARKGRPMILSTGMSEMREVEQTVRTLQKAGQDQIALLHCVSSYPAPTEDVNLRAMDTLRQVFNVPVGYSDHTEGIRVAVLAVACGACIIEKHLTLDRKLPGPDHRMSLEPDEFKTMVRAVRSVETALGDGVKRPMESERNTRAIARRSLVAATDLPAGTVLEAHHLTAKRPGLGLPPSELARLIGRRLSKSLRADDMITWSDMA